MMLLAALFFSSQNSPLGILIVFLFGVLLFAFGFRIFREYRLLADTPFIPIRSVAMGLVHVRGKALGDERLTSPLTRQPCFCFKLDVERYEQQGKDSGWRTIHNERESHAFFLEDGTDKVLVEPRLAEFDVLQTFRGEIGPRSKSKPTIDPSLTMPAPSEQKLRTFVQERLLRARPAAAPPATPSAAAPAPSSQPKPKGFHISLGNGGLQFEFSTNHSYRVTEKCLIAERDCNILGTCMENPNSKDDADRNLITKGQHEKTFLITTQTEKQEEKTLRNRSMVLVLLGSVPIIFAAALGIYEAMKAPAPTAGHVTAMTLTAHPAKDNGPCPGRITFSGDITTDGPAKVAYKYDSSMKFANGQEKVWPGGVLTFAAAGRQSITKTITFVGDGSHISAWLTVAANSPSPNHSNEAPFSIECVRNQTLAPPQ